MLGTVERMETGETRSALKPEQFKGECNTQIIHTHNTQTHTDTHIHTLTHTHTHTHTHTLTHTHTHTQCTRRERGDSERELLLFVNQHVGQI